MAPFPFPILLPLLLIFILSPNLVYAADLIEFLFKHQSICGNPFSDAQWVPVLDICELDCHPEREICMEDDQMKQSCRKLPQSCVDLFRAEQSSKKGSIRRNPPPAAVRQPKATNQRQQKEKTMTTGGAGEGTQDGREAKRSIGRAKGQLKPNNSREQSTKGKERSMANVNTTAVANKQRFSLRKRMVQVQPAVKIREERSLARLAQVV